MLDLSQTLGWQFSLGFALGLAAGLALAVLARASRVPVGYRGRTPPNAGRIIPPRGGSGTAKRTGDSDTGEYPSVRG